MYKYRIPTNFDGNIYAFTFRIEMYMSQTRTNPGLFSSCLTHEHKLTVGV